MGGAAFFVLHGERAVAALKHYEGAVIETGDIDVLHGERAVAALKRWHRCAVGYPGRSFSTVFGPWPH